MGEVEKTLERLNKALVEAGFPKAEPGMLGKGEDCWYMDVHFSLWFDSDGKFIVPAKGT